MSHQRYSDALRRVAPYLDTDCLRILARWERQSEPDPAGWDTAEAVYWFATFHYQGQGDPLYSALCATKFDPGPLASTVTSDTTAALIYADLCATLRHDPERAD